MDYSKGAGDQWWIQASIAIPMKTMAMLQSPKKLDLAIAQAKNLLKHAATGHWRDKGQQPLDDQQQRQG